MYCHLKQHLQPATINVIPKAHKVLLYQRANKKINVASANKEKQVGR